MLPPCGIPRTKLCIARSGAYPCRHVRLSALATAFRLLLLGLLLSGFVLKPALAFAEEVHELTAHAAEACDATTMRTPPVDRAPAPDDGGPPHDDDHWHLTHCCGHQAAVLPRLELDASRTGMAVSPIPSLVGRLRAGAATAPFRPPITA